MSACDGCGAPIDPRAEACVYCKKVTPYGAHMRDYRAHQEVAAQHHRWAFWHHARMQGVGQAQRTGSRALISGLLGLVPCFCAVPSLIAIVLAVQARSQAKRYGEPTPGTAVAAVVFGGLAIAVFVTAIVGSQLELAKRNKRIAALEKEVAGELDGPTIKLDSACKLGEIKLLQEGYPGGKYTKRVECAPARLVEQGDYLALDSVRVTLSKSTEMLTFCMKKGQRWAVEKIVLATSRCNASDATPTSRPLKGEDDNGMRREKGSPAPDDPAPRPSASATPTTSARGRRR